MKRMLTVLAAVISAVVSQMVMADGVAKRTISAAPVVSSGAITSYRVSVGPGEGSQGVYALYGTHEPTATEMWEKVDFLGTVDAKGGKFTFVPQGEWAVVRFAVGQFYVRDSLLAYWDGIWNLRSGHSSSCSDGRSWENLASVNYDFTLKANGAGTWPVVEERDIDFRQKFGYALLSAESTAATFGTLASAGGTMEISLKANQDFKLYSQTILRSSDASNVAFWMNDGGCGFQGDNPTGGRAAGVNGGGFKDITTVSVAYNENKLPSKARKDGVDMTLTGAGYGIEKPTAVDADGTIVGRLNPGDDTKQHEWYTGKIYAIRLYSRSLTADEAVRNAAVDKVRFASSGLTEMKEGVAESLSVLYGNAVDHSVSVTANAVNPTSKNVSYASYDVTVGAGTVKGELWMFCGKVPPVDDGDYESWEFKQKIADVPLAGGVWTVSRPQDSDWRAQGYAVRFAVLENYVTNGLTGRFDGICNTRNGHSASLTKWGNLIAGQPDLTMHGAIGVQPNALRFSGAMDCYAEMSKETFPTMMPYVYGETKTVEAVFKISSESDDSRDQYVMQSYYKGAYTIVSKTSSLVLWEMDEKPWAVSRNSLKDLSTIGVNYKDVDNGYRWVRTTAYINGVASESSGSNVAGGSAERFCIGTKNTDWNRTVETQCPFQGDFFGLRFYVRQLTADEFAHNAALDKVRFGSSCAHSTIAGETIAGESEIIWSARDPQGLVIVVQ